MSALLHDLRLAARSLRRAPSFTIPAILTLALGIGATAAIFSVVDGVLLRPTPFPDADRLVMVWQTDRTSGTTREPASVPDFADFERRSTQFASLAAFTATEGNLTGNGTDPARVAVLAVSHAFLPTLGLAPIAGRLLTAEETTAGGPPAALVSAAFATRVLDGAGNAVGKSIRLDDVETPIVGVMPDRADFGTVQLLSRAAYGRSFAERGDRTRVDVWTGLRASPESPRDNHPIFVIGRLTPSATAQTAQAEMTRVAAELESAYPSNRGRGVFLEPIGETVFGPVRPALMVLLASVALVLLVACGNVANLLLVRGSARVRETSVRVALGARPGQLARQFLAESALLTGVGAVLGLMVAFAGTRLLLSLAPASLPRVDEVGLDVRLLLATLATCVVVSLVFGSIPLLQTRVRDLHGALQGGGRGASAGRAQRRLRATLVVAELAMAVMLLSGAGLLTRSLWQLQNVDPGFDTAGVLKAEFQLPASRYPQDRSQFPAWPAHQRFFAELEARLAALPGVAGATVSAANPLDPGFTSSIRVVGRESEGADWPEPAIRAVSASYFTTMGVDLMQGRSFSSSDAANAPSVVAVNASAAERFFGARPALGQRIQLWGAERTVVAVIENEHFKGIEEDVPPAVYLPLTQVPIGSAILVRLQGAGTMGASESRARMQEFIPTLRRVVAELDPQLPLFGIEPLRDTLSTSIAQQRFMMLVLVVFAGVAVALSAIGIHGVLSYTVAQRTREIGIRLALGAAPAGVRSLILREGLMLGVAGVAIGTGGALALAGVLSSLLFGIGARDPFTFAGVAIGLGLITLIASWLPARRAGALDPSGALRAD
ncbi:MAG TPA: ABC transporter permease [Gemmatimonas sp.]|nr:ABC transporter permease [Gemmatimonas sp.]